MSCQKAESLFQESQVVSSDVEQNSTELRIILNLTDNRSFVIEYDTRERRKRYFIGDPKI
jgi:hypothetical protein